MVFNADKWKAAYAQAVKDLKGQAPAAGIVCQLATLRVMRDGLIDDVVGGKEAEASEDDKAYCQTIRDSISELFKSLKDAKTFGFASNASAASAAAGFKAESKAAMADVEV